VLIGEARDGAIAFGVFAVAGSSGGHAFGGDAVPEYRFAFRDQGGITGSRRIDGRPNCAG
jgi:hypothetical protein